MKLAGISLASDGIDIVVLSKASSGQFTLLEEQSFNLPTGDRAKAYHTIYGQVADFFEHRDIHCVCMKESAVSLGGTKKGHLTSAELRGVIQAAAASICDVKLMNKAATSRSFGSRKVDEYVKDDAFWIGAGLSNLKKGKREAA